MGVRFLSRQVFKSRWIFLASWGVIATGVVCGGVVGVLSSIRFFSSCFEMPRIAEPHGWYYRWFIVWCPDPLIWHEFLYSRPSVPIGFCASLAKLSPSLLFSCQVMSW